MARAAPDHLSDRAKALWRAVVPSKASSIQRQASVLAALEALDRADQARARIDADGLMLEPPKGGMAHAHPLLKVEKDSRQLFAKLWRELYLTVDPRD